RARLDSNNRPINSRSIGGRKYTSTIGSGYRANDMSRGMSHVARNRVWNWSHYVGMVGRRRIRRSQSLRPRLSRHHFDLVDSAGANSEGSVGALQFDRPIDDAAASARRTMTAVVEGARFPGGAGRRPGGRLHQRMWLQTRPSIRGNLVTL